MYQAFSVGCGDGSSFVYAERRYLKKYIYILLDSYGLNKGGYFRDQYISLLGSIDTC